ncbi:hypothetical protein EDB82DRAFT_18579 [Fusarium venenatum]|uniref:uncharacterized protein n=1 Tax=Fusarium venenatum TaxID=56646 RepID=UPI001D36B388|nr:hypothetical protein EDB82DRAFT_18579 [Fusarium venenatum]
MTTYLVWVAVCQILLEPRSICYFKMMSFCQPSIWLLHEIVCLHSIAIPHIIIEMVQRKDVGYLDGHYSFFIVVETSPAIRSVSCLPGSIT